MENERKTYPTVCSRCGKTFDASLEGFVNKGNGQQMCAACYRKNFEKPSVVSIIANIIVIPIILFFLLAVVVSVFEGDVEGIILCGASALILSLWRLIVFLKRKAKGSKWERIEIVEEVRVINWQCPHCGANTCGEICEYCDSPYSK